MPPASSTAFSAVAISLALAGSFIGGAAILTAQESSQRPIGTVSSVITDRSVFFTNPDQPPTAPGSSRDGTGAQPTSSTLEGADILSLPPNTVTPGSDSAEDKDREVVIGGVHEDGDSGDELSDDRDVDTGGLEYDSEDEDEDYDD